ncbi:MAG: toxin ParE1/3/4 [Bradyrhizobium sp.]|jgi:plasmid stabilization system protein ParE|nr:toxin ParE1/3/4 [Bradyrhizobium sp.]
MTDILDYLEARSPEGAESVKRRLKAAIDLIADHPKSGRATNKADLRRLVANPYPYVIFYRTDTTGIVIHGFAIPPVARVKAAGASVGRHP